MLRIAPHSNVGMGQLKVSGTFTLMAGLANTIKLRTITIKIFTFSMKLSIFPFPFIGITITPFVSS